MQHRLTPQFILDRLAQGETAGRFDAACLFVDISGFTPLTITLMEHGTEGAEVLAHVLVSVFEPLIDAVYRQGGFIAGFAGDAFKALFPIDDEFDRQTVSARALLAAWAIRAHLVDSPSQSTRFGEFTFSGKVCAASGPVDWAIWQDAPKTDHGQRAASLFNGDGLAQTMAIDPYAVAGQVVISEELARALSHDALTTTPVDAYLRVDALDAARLPMGLPTSSPSPPTPGRPRAADFYPERLLGSELQGEFRQVVTLFVNFERSFDPAELDSFRIALFHLLDQYEGFLGRVGQIGGKDNGNTLLLFWGAPTGSEHDVERALGFILDLQDASPVRLRAGVTTRMAYAGFVGSPLAEEYTCYGSYVNLAARQLVAAGWGEIWLDDESKRQASRRFQTERRGALRFKGFVDPQPIFTLVDRRAIDQQTFYAGALIGRQVEIDSLMANVQPIFNGDFAGIITIEGEAGLGKSRLVHEFETVAGALTPTPRWFLCQTDDILRRPLNPFRYWLRRYFGQSRDASEQANRAALDGALDDLLRSMPETEVGARLAEDLNRSRSFLAALVDLHWHDSLYAQLEPQLRLENMLDALKTLIKAESLVQPVFLLLEDAHWLDDESRQFIDQLTRNVEGFPFVVLATQRPGVGAESLAADDVAHTLIQLSGLADDQVGPIATALLNGRPSPALTALIAARANGNPFFVEQIALFLHEHGMLKPGESGWELAQGDSEGATLLPTDVRALLTARLDQLPPPVKEMVQTASVLGREFDTRVLAAMLDDEDDGELNARLYHARQARIWSAINEARYLFRHALLRDASYDMQLRSRLRRLHRAAAGAVRAVYAGDPAPHYAELVHHYRQGEAYDEERKFADLAGEYASEQFANEEALRFFERAIELADENDGVSISRLLMKHEDVAYTSGNRAAQQSDLDQLSALATAANKSLQAEVLLRTGNHARVLTDYERAISALKRGMELAQEIGDIDLNARVCNCLGKTYWRQNRYPEAEKELSRSLELATSSGSDALVADNLYHLGLIDYSKGEYSSAMALFEAAHRQHVNDGNQKGITQCLSMFGAIHNNLGDYVAAQEDYDRGLEICRSIGWRHTEAHYLALIGNNDLDVGRYDLASASHAKALALTRELGDQEGAALSLDVLGLIAHEQMAFSQAVDYFLRAIGTQESIGDRSGLAYSLTHLGYTQISMGEFVDAAKSFERAISLRQAIDERGTLIDSVAGFALAQSEAGEYAVALKHAQDITDQINAEGDDGIEYPIRVYLILYRIFQAASQGESRYAAPAQSALEEGHRMLLARAEAILDEGQRQSYMQNVSFNREIDLAWKARGR